MFAMTQSEQSHCRLNSSHVHKRAAFAAILAGLLAGPAFAARVEWSHGGTDLTIKAAQRCTLEVVFTPEETVSLREWRLVWVADPSDGRPLRVVVSEGSAETDAACDVRQDKDGDQGAHVDTAYFCASMGTVASARSVRYVLDVPSAVRTRIAVIPIVGTDGIIRADAAGIAEASINGGSALSLPPVLVDIAFANTPDATTYHIFGAYLGELQDAHIRQPSSGAIIPIDILSRSAGSVELKGPLLERVRYGLVEVRNRSGQWTSIPIDWPASGLKRVVAPRLVVQVERSSLSTAIKSPAGDGTGASTLLPALAAALTRAGVVSISTLSSGESSAVGRSDATNLIGEPIELAPLDDWLVATLGLDAEVAVVLERVRDTPGVREVFEDTWRYLANVTPNDPRFGQQWGLWNSPGTVCGYPSSFADIGAVSAWNQTTGSPNVRLAILDTGINPTHEDFGTNRVMLGPDYVNGGGNVAYDDNGHGTAVAGIAAAVGNNAKGVAGVAWQVQPWAIKVLDYNAGGSPANLRAGILWASAKMIPILNMSLGWSEGSADLGPDGHNLLADATLDAFKRGLFLVASSGNKVDSPLFGPFNACPADLDKRVYAVGAFLPNGQRWQDIGVLGFTDCPFNPCMESNYGEFLDAMAPGGRMITTTGLGDAVYLDLANCTQYDRSTMAFGGTSASAPFVSGIATLLLARRPELIGEDIAQILNRTALGNFPSGDWNHETGWGRVNATTALNFIGPGKTIAHWGAGPGPYSLGPLQVIDSLAIASRLFRDVPGMPSNIYTTSCVRYRLTATLTWPFPFSSDVKGWTRSSGTLAWKDIEPYYYREEVDTATFVPATFGPSGVTVEAFVFRVKSATNPAQTIGWFPTDPAHAHVALTVIGTPEGTTDAGPGRVAARLAVTTLPNPSRSAVKMAVDVPARGHVRMMVVDLAGRRVATLVERELDAGRHEFWWDGGTDNGERCPAGVYFCRVDCGGISTMTRFIRLSGNR